MKKKKISVNNSILASSYLDSILNPNFFKKLMGFTPNYIKENFPNVTHLAFTGNSGALVGMAIAANSGLLPLLVRKENVGGNHHHSSLNIEGYLPIGGGEYEYLIVDDRVCSGSTIRRIIGIINQEAPRYYSQLKFKLAGVLMYDRSVGSIEEIRISPDGQTDNIVWAKAYGISS